MLKKLVFNLIFAITLLFSVNAQDVNSSGAFTYSYPIELPQGTNGMEPNLSLNYNSQAGNGMLGMGWNLSGFQTISRDQSYELKWDRDDHFVLNGQRLIKDGSSYRTENESFLKIEYINKASITSSYWVVTHKNGTQLFFGNTVDSRIEGVDKTEARIWALNKVIDVHGNYYTIEYKEDEVGGDYYPQKMVYTKNDDNSLLKVKEVIFSYETNRTDHYAKYNPSKIDLNERLRWISVLIDGQLLRKYELKYLVQDDAVTLSQLSIIQQYGTGSQIPPMDATGWVSSDTDSLKLPPTKFDWMINKNGLAKVYTEVNLNKFYDLHGVSNENLKRYLNIVPADVDGDGRTDIVAIDVDSGLWRIIFSKDDEFEPYVNETNLTNFYDLHSVSNENLQRYLNIYPADVNGDGLTDLVVLDVDSGSWRILFSNGKGFNKIYTEENLSNFYDLHSVTNENLQRYLNIFPMDVNGNGLTDLVVLDVDSGLWRILYSNGHGFEPYVNETNLTNFYDLHGVTNANLKRYLNFTPADVNGDGLTDLVVLDVDSASWRIIFSNGHGLDEIYTEDNLNNFYDLHSVSNENLQRYLNIYPADVNGDGLTDLVVLDVDSGSWRILFSNGKGFNKIYTEENLSNFYDLHSVTNENLQRYLNIFPMDVNGNGLTDLVVLDVDSGLWRILYSNGHGFEPYVNETNLTNFYDLHSVTNENLQRYLNFTLANLNGDGQSILAVDVDSGLWRTIHKSNKTSLKISSITLPSGATITPTYTPAPQTPDAINSSDSTYPNISNKSPRSLVTSLDITDGMGKTYTSTYKYNNGKYHRAPKRDGIKGLGFEWTQKTNPDGTYSKTYYYQEDQLELAGLAKRIENYGSDGLLYSAVEDVYSVKELIAVTTTSDPYHAINSIKKTDSYSYNFNGVTYTDWVSLKALADVVKTHKKYTYDNFGNVTEVLDKGDLADKSDDILTVTTYANNAQKNIFKPHLVKRYSFGLDEVNFDGTTLHTIENLASSEEFFYDDNLASGILGDRALLTKKIIYSGEMGTNLDKYPDSVTEYTYDIYGNPISVKDGFGSTSSIQYEENYHSFPESKTNALGQILETTIYDQWMRPKYSKDTNDNYTWFSFDIFGRESAVSLGTSTAKGTDLGRTEYSDSVVTAIAPMWIKKSAYLPENPNLYLDGYTYMDGMGQVLQEKSESLDENGIIKWKTIDYFYDLTNKKTRVSHPYFSDSHSYNHNNERALVHDETVQFADAIGRVDKIEYSNGISEFFQYGLRSKTTLAYNSLKIDESQIYYEEYKGRKKISYSYKKGNHDLNTFDKNSWVYRVTTLNARDGSKISEITNDDLAANKEGNSLVTITDRLGRKKNYDDPDMGLWSYEYDKNGNLIKQTDNKLNVITFEYDALNRVTTKFGANTVYYSYDDKLHDGINPDPKDHGFSAVGKLTNITFSNGSYIEDYYYDDVNKVYKIAKEIDGYSRTLTTTHDEIGRIISELLPGTDNETLSYDYNESGNLKSIATNLQVKNYIDSFTYDVNSRIRNFTQGNDINTSFTYNKDRLTGIDILNGTIKIADLDYTYDKWGNITNKIFNDDFSGYYSEKFSYDELFRLSKAESIGLYGTKSYAYDYYNNMTQNNNRSYEYTSTLPVHGGPHAVQEVKDQWGGVQKTYEYDENGNVKKISGQSHLVVKARGTGVLVNPPKMELWINGQGPETIWTVNKETNQVYTWHGFIPPGSTVDIVFANDNSDGGVDTNLIVDYIHVNGVDIHSESALVTYDRGGYSSGCFDGADSISGQENMTLTGALRFPISPSTAALERILNYDKENRLTSIVDNGVTNTTFAYNDVGQRIWKKENDVKTYYFFENYEEEYIISTSTLKVSNTYYFANGMRVAMRSSIDGVLYNHTDHLGSAVRMTDASANIVQSIAYTPFGKVAWFAGKDVSDYTYTDQEIDDSGFMYYDARYYDPDLGRFLQADTKLDGMNRYTYCGNNPIIYSDPTGHDGGLSLLIGASIMLGAYITAAFLEAVVPEVVDWIQSIMAGTELNMNGTDFALTAPGIQPDFGNDTVVSTTQLDSDIQNATMQSGRENRNNIPYFNKLEGIGFGFELVLLTSVKVPEYEEIPPLFSWLPTTNGIEKGESLVGKVKYKLGAYRGEANGSMIIPGPKNGKMDCSEFISYSNITFIFRSGEFHKSWQYYEVKKSMRMTGDVIIWRATDSNTNFREGHEAIYIRSSGNKAILHNDGKGVRYSSNYLTDWYNNNEYTNVTERYFRRWLTLKINY